MDEATRHGIKRLLNNRLDWDYIVRSSTRHGISPLVYWNLCKIDTGKKVPEDVMTELRERYYNNIARNMLLYNELSNVLKAFTDAGIDVIVLKGAFLAEAVYKNIGLRAIGDVDVLVKKGDLSIAKNALARLGYNPIQCDLTQWHADQGRLLTHMHLPPYCNKQGLWIEVHWDLQTLASPFRIDINAFWSNAQPATIADVDALKLAPEDLLQHLCLHLDQHLRSGAIPLRWYCDIAEVIQHYEEEIDWNYLVQQSKNYGIEDPMYQGVYIVSNYLGSFVSAHVLHDLKPANVDCDNIDDLFRISLGGTVKKGKEGMGYFRMITKVDGIVNKAHLLFDAVFPSKEYMMRRYSIKNKKLIYVYYLSRFGTVLRSGLNVLWYVLRYPFKELL
jgi:hypothetical protein